ncbi:class I SAM-dependent methyltransferase [Halopiger goleimassiliensis]|uniref:class I SAM-dependent methyltransferase n=1 Tax=Halopiger goleimassiliensis TaxID=1293048 RepID=UPI000677CEB7|nr:class I SAM-dependent methyltransferase [Halopiger goleimassiliensis]
MAEDPTEASDPEDPPQGSDRTRAAVRETYDRIGAHFAETREYAWPEVEAFVDRHGPRIAATDDPGVGLDLGCGNCRHAELLTSVDGLESVVGVDVSRELLRTGRNRATEREFAVDLVQGDAATLPLATDAVSIGVYVATLHHLPRPEIRRASLDELARVLAADGRALVSAWSTAHDRFDRSDGFDTTLEWTLPGGETVDRFYHIYDPAEFERELEASDLQLLEWELSSGNCYADVAGAP